MYRVGAIVLTILSISACLTGCGDRVEACNRLVESVNPHTEKVSRAVEALASVERDAAAPDRLAGTVDDAEQALAAVALDDPQLAGWLLAYRKQLAAAKEASTAVAAAARAGDQAALHDAVAKADRVVGEQDALLREINEYCARPAP